MSTKLRIKFKAFELEFEGEDKFAKADLLELMDEMKLATAFYRDTFGNNLTATLRRLVKSGKIHENGTNFALSDTLSNTIKGQLAK